ncbi:DUF421 domain-containing protein [Curtobacterium ammoniigenes]|uniref:DUF421 domain-containing protein n=1 Tax=Curtobacterium ammoniigenes TaxID=395387 RepID=UPI0009FAE85A|nr:YetF domain-containing protein [Curtobacterium ammoniigenes]
MWQRLGVDGTGAGAVVIAAVGIAVAILVLVRVFGQRPLARMSMPDLIVVLTLGSIAGRAVLGSSVTLVAGVIALVTIFTLHWAVELIGRGRRFRGVLNARPVLLVADGELQVDLLRRARVSEAELREALRASGVVSRSEVACAIFEATGSVSVFRAGRPIEPWMVEGVLGWERLATHLLGPAESDHAV